jgi:dipeptidyl aminopeptidase/acylaminoacyl peptidase
MIHLMVFPGPAFRALRARFFWAGVLTAALAIPAAGRIAVPTPWTVDDVVLAEEASGFRIAPDQRRVVWVKKTPDKAQDKLVANLFLSSLTEPAEVQLTRGSENCLDPKWSPDGRRIAFLSTRPPAKKEANSKDEPQLWLINPFGGEPWPLTRGEQGVLAYEWAGPDTLVFTAKDPPPDHKKPGDEDNTIVVEDEEHEPPVRLFSVSAATGKVTRVTDNRDRIQAFSLSPDGHWAVTTHARSLRYDYDNRVRPAYYLYDLRAGSRRRAFRDRRFNLDQIHWARDGKGFYAANLFTTSRRYVMATVTELYYFDLAAGEPARVDLGWERGLSAQWENGGAAAFQVTTDGFLALLADGARNRAVRYTRDGTGWRRAELTGAHAGQLYAFETGGDDRTIVYASSTAGTPTQWHHARLDGTRLCDPVPLTRLNAHLRTKPLARAEVVHWKGARGEEVEGLLYYPHGYQAGRRYPLVALAHGGPALAEFDAWTETWSHPQNLLCARGAFVLKPNYHGSSNYGLAWAESLAGGNYLDLELTDLETGVDALVARGLADPERLGLMGRSNGAILVAALTTQTTRYKVASCAGGTVEQASDWGSTEYGAAFDEYYLGKSPLASPRRYVAKSPFYRLDRVRTPTIVFMGSEDRVVGAHQGWLHFRGLQQTGKAPVRFLLFPGAGHDLERLSHQRRKLQEELAWFDRYLFGKDGKPAR